MLFRSIKIYKNGQKLKQKNMFLFFKDNYIYIYFDFLFRILEHGKVLAGDTDNFKTLRMTDSWSCGGGDVFAYGSKAVRAFLRFLTFVVDCQLA